MLGNLCQIETSTTRLYACFSHFGSNYHLLFPGLNPLSSKPGVVLRTSLEQNMKEGGPLVLLALTLALASGQRSEDFVGFSYSQADVSNPSSRRFVSFLSEVNTIITMFRTKPHYPRPPPLCRTWTSTPTFCPDTALSRPPRPASTASTLPFSVPGLRLLCKNSALVQCYYYYSSLSYPA